MTLSDVKEKVVKLRATHDVLSAQKRKRERSIQDLRRYSAHVDEAQVVLQTVAQQTQSELEYHISELVTLANESVFDDPYTMKVQFVLRRNKTEADLLFERDGHFINPMDASGGGAVDVAAFALRISLLSLQTPKSADVLILDEPFRFVSRSLQERASKLLKEISEKLGLQMIIVTHEPTLVEHADRVFTVTQKNGISNIQDGDAQ